MEAHTKANGVSRIPPDQHEESHNQGLESVQNIVIADEATPASYISPDQHQESHNQGLESDDESVIINYEALHPWTFNRIPHEVPPGEHMEAHTEANRESHIPPDQHEEPHSQGLESDVESVIRHSETLHPWTSGYIPYPVPPANRRGLQMWSVNEFEELSPIYQAYATHLMRHRGWSRYYAVRSAQTRESTVRRCLDQDYQELYRLVHVKGYDKFLGRGISMVQKLWDAAISDQDKAFIVCTFREYAFACPDMTGYPDMISCWDRDLEHLGPSRVVFIPLRV